MLDFQAFETNRQMYQEAFALFWGTSGFCFEEADVRKKFSETLNEAQRADLKHTVLDIGFGSEGSHDENWHPTYWSFRREWPVCHLNNASLHPLKPMQSLELHLELTHLERGHSRVIQIRTIRAIFGVMANWRLLHLKQVWVTVSYANRATRWATNGQLFKNGELWEMAQSFQRILLNPTVTEEDQARFLTYEIQDLEHFLVEQAESNKSYSESSKSHLEIARKCQELVRRGQVITEDVKDRLTKMRATLERKNGDEMHNLVIAQEQRPQIASSSELAVLVDSSTTK